MKRCTFALIVAVFCFTSTGCSVFNASQQAWTKTARMVRPRPFDGPGEPNAPDDEWSFVGDEGRGDQERESDPDPWWQNWVMSDQARAIERNLGID